MKSSHGQVGRNFELRRPSRYCGSAQEAALAQRLRSVSEKSLAARKGLGRRADQDLGFGDLDLNRKRRRKTLNRRLDLVGVERGGNFKTA